ncbi:sensor c-di-GMP phosphodiesterase-like protein [Ochrobactrum anthropi]|uniref:EAL domain-containing protein n=1 Tax=Brucella anthropi TaxID=529 RepID=UPI0015F8EBD5|nr:EAL domain-containing protein [Brucella anthropi]MBA8862850.1 sensor c-di-GMP phosphodiesterase-like protein [Brucella anthropi]
MVRQFATSRRRQVTFVSCLIALVGSLIISTSVALVLWKIASRKEQIALNAQADQTIIRALHIYEEAQLLLETMQLSTEPPCSVAHIARMRDQTMNTSSVEEIGYFENGALKCTSWGKTNIPTQRAKSDYVTREGLDIVIRLKPTASMNGQMMAIGLGDYNALIAPSRFVDISIGDQTSLLLLNDRNQIIVSRDPLHYFPKTKLIFDAKWLVNAGYLVATSAKNGFKAVVIEPRSNLLKRVRTELPIFLAAGALIEFLFLAAVYFFATQRLSPKAELLRAISQREFVVEYQPIVELNTGRCVGAEALVRWQLSDGRRIGPDLFIPLAEEVGLISEITQQVIDQIVWELCDVLVSDRSMHIAVNISSADIQSGRILDYLQSSIQPTGIDNDQIWLEATERGFMDIESARVTLDRARELGHAVAIDDFGTGYSSLQYLQGLNLDAIKIDKSFVDTIGQTSSTNSVILHIIGLIQALELVSVAEGVETAEQAAFLRKHGVTHAQGWLFSKPLSAQKFIDYHNSRSVSSSKINSSGG